MFQVLIVRIGIKIPSFLKESPKETGDDLKTGDEIEINWEKELISYLECSWYECRTIESGSHVKGSFSLHSYQSTGQIRVCSLSALFLISFG